MFHGGGIAGVGSHQYIHNTPADYRSITSFIAILITVLYIKRVYDLKFQGTLKVK